MNTLILLDLPLSFSFEIGCGFFKFRILDKFNHYGYLSNVFDNCIYRTGSTRTFLLVKILVEYGYLFTFILFFLSIGLKMGGI
jgi:hypothetical protein